MLENSVMVTSMANAIVGINIPEMRFRKEWIKKGAQFPISKDILREAIYYPGVEHLFKNGVLYISDMDFKREIGLEPAEAEEPTIIELNDALLNRIVKLMPYADAEATIKKLSVDQRQELVEYAVAHYLDCKMDRIAMISELCKVDLMTRIKLVSEG